MSSILNMVSASEQVLIDGKPFTLRGLSIKTIGKVFTRFPDVQRWMDNEQVPDMVAAIAAIPEAAADVIVGGIKGADDTTRVMVEDLELIVQLDLIEKIVLLTARGGVGPLRARIARLKGALVPGDTEASQGAQAAAAASSLNSGSSLPA